MTGTVHIIGAGVAGLAAAIQSVQHGQRVQLYEAARYAGGRCRAYFEPALGQIIDNGTHLVLGANPAVWWYTRTIGSQNQLMRLSTGAFPMWDAATRVTYQQHPMDILLKSPAAALRLALAGSKATVGACVGETLWRARLWQPLTESIMNTPLPEASAAVLRRVLWQVGQYGRAGMSAYLATPTLADAFVTPALAWLQGHGAAIYYHKRLKAIHGNDARVGQLVFTDAVLPVAKGDRVILALPVWQVLGLFPDFKEVVDTAPIVNVHYALSGVDVPPVLGIVNGMAHWVFARPHGLSVTVSAADTLALQPVDAIAADIWAELRLALPSLPAALPAHKVIKEKNATFRATPAFEAQRQRLYHAMRARYANLLLCGDWCAFGLPSTLEGSLQSGMHVFGDEA